LPIAVVGLFLGGVRFKQAAIVTVAAALLLPLAWHALKPYQRDRLTSFMHPEADSQGSGYQVNQSLIAVGSGGIWGNSEGSQTHLAFYLSTNGLYLCRIRRGTWFCRCPGGNAVILYSADAIDPETRKLRPTALARS